MDHIIRNLQSRYIGQLKDQHIPGVIIVITGGTILAIVTAAKFKSTGSFVAQVVGSVEEAPALLRHLIGHGQIGGLTVDHTSVQTQIIGGSLIADRIDIRITGGEGPVQVIIHRALIGFGDGIVSGVSFRVGIMGRIRFFLTLLRLDGNCGIIVAVITTQSVVGFRSHDHIGSAGGDFAGREHTLPKLSGLGGVGQHHRKGGHHITFKANAGQTAGGIFVSVLLCLLNLIVLQCHLRSIDTIRDRCGAGAKRLRKLPGNESAEQIGFLRSQQISFHLGCAFQCFRCKHRGTEGDRSFDLGILRQPVRLAVQQQLHLIEAGIAHVVRTFLHPVAQCGDHGAVAGGIAGCGDFADLQRQSFRKISSAADQHLCEQVLIIEVKLAAVAQRGMLMLLLAEQNLALTFGKLTVAKDHAAEQIIGQIFDFTVRIACQNLQRGQLAFAAEHQLGHNAHTVGCYLLILGIRIQKDQITGFGKVIHRFTQQAHGFQRRTEALATGIRGQAADICIFQAEADKGCAPIHIGCAIPRAVAGIAFDSAVFMPDHIAFAFPVSQLRRCHLQKVLRPVAGQRKIPQCSLPIIRGFNIRLGIIIRNLAGYIVLVDGDRANQITCCIVAFFQMLMLALLAVEILLHRRQRLRIQEAGIHMDMLRDAADQLRLIQLNHLKAGLIMNMDHSGDQAADAFPCFIKAAGGM